MICYTFAKIISVATYNEVKMFLKWYDHGGILNDSSSLDHEEPLIVSANYVGERRQHIDFYVHTWMTLTNTQWPIFHHETCHSLFLENIDASESWTSIAYIFPGFMCRPT